MHTYYFESNFKAAGRSRQGILAPILEISLGNVQL
jgi:hypothetical protein